MDHKTVSLSSYAAHIGTKIDEAVRKQCADGEKGVCRNTSLLPLTSRGLASTPICGTLCVLHSGRYIYRVLSCLKFSKEKINAMAVREKCRKRPPSHVACC